MATQPSEFVQAMITPDALSQNLVFPDIPILPNHLNTQDIRAQITADLRAYTEGVGIDMTEVMREAGANARQNLDDAFRATIATTITPEPIPLDLNTTGLFIRANDDILRWDTAEAPRPRIRTTHEFDEPADFTPNTIRRTARVWPAQPSTRYEERKRLISDEFSVDGPINYTGLLTSIFSPFIFHSLPSQEVRCAKIEVFKRRFKIDSKILDPVMALYSKGLKFVLAGGKLVDFCNNVSLEDSTNDYDLWSVEDDSFRNIERYLMNNAGEHQFVHKPHLMEFIHESKKFQAINTIYSGLEHVIQSFDFRACAIATDGEYIYWVKGALRDIKEKTLVVLNVQANKGTVLRTQKYIQRGYNISGPDFALASLSCLLSFDNDRSDIIDYFTKRRQSLGEINDAFSSGVDDYEHFGQNL